MGKSTIKNAKKGEFAWWWLNLHISPPVDDFGSNSSVAASYTQTALGGLEHEWMIFPDILGRIIITDEVHHFSEG